MTLFILFFAENPKQYVEENERLRAILGEWSTRAAKVTTSPRSFSYTYLYILGLDCECWILVYSSSEHWKLSGCRTSNYKRRFQHLETKHVHLQLNQASSVEPKFTPSTPICIDKSQHFWSGISFFFLFCSMLKWRIQDVFRKRPILYQ